MESSSAGLMVLAFMSGTIVPTADVTWCSAFLISDFVVLVALLASFAVRPVVQLSPAGLPVCLLSVF
jgi:hypothetical protein